MRIVTGGAVLTDRRVLPQHRSPHFGVAGEQLSATELPVRSAFTLLIEPCGLWQLEQDILPSRTGMCATARSVLVTWVRWHVAHNCVSVFFTSCLAADTG